MTFELVEVTWIDTAGGGGWSPVAQALEDAEPDVMRSVGYVIRDDDEALVIVQSQTERAKDDGTPELVADWLAIPRENVERVRKLE